MGSHATTVVSTVVQKGQTDLKINITFYLCYSDIFLKVTSNSKPNKYAIKMYCVLLLPVLPSLKVQLNDLR